MPSGTTGPSVAHLRTSLGSAIKRLIVVGDVHGCLNELKSLLLKLGFDSAHDALIFVGDIVAKGPLSVDTARFVESLMSAHPNRVFCVRGNHEDNTLLAYYYPEGKRGRDPEFEFARKFTRKDIQFLEQLPLTIELEDVGVRVVHAGWDSELRPEHLIRMRTIKSDTHEPSKEGPEEGLRTLWASLYDDPDFIVIFGHDAKRRLQKHPRAIGLDTGCVYGGSLSAAVASVLSGKPLQVSDFVIHDVRAESSYKQVEDE